MKRRYDKSRAEQTRTARVLEIRHEIDAFRAVRESVAGSAPDFEMLSKATGIRPAILRFALLMEYKLRVHEDKGTWEGIPRATLNGALRAELDEMDMAHRYEPPSAECLEAADVANFAMMIADNAERELHAEANKWPEPEERAQFKIPG